MTYAATACQPSLTHCYPQVNHLEGCIWLIIQEKKVLWFHISDHNATSMALCARATSGIATRQGSRLMQPDNKHSHFLP
jgi:hypothetical protein